MRGEHHFAILGMRGDLTYTKVFLLRGLPLRRNPGFSCLVAAPQLLGIGKPALPMSNVKQFTFSSVGPHHLGARDEKRFPFISRWMILWHVQRFKRVPIPINLRVPDAIKTNAQKNARNLADRVGHQMEMPLGRTDPRLCHINPFGVPEFFKRFGFKRLPARGDCVFDRPLRRIHRFTKRLALARRERADPLDESRELTLPAEISNLELLEFSPRPRACHCSFCFLLESVNIVHSRSDSIPALPKKKKPRSAGRSEASGGCT